MMQNERFHNEMKNLSAEEVPGEGKEQWRNPHGLELGKLPRVPKYLRS